MKPKYRNKRLSLIVLFGLPLIGACILVLNALEKNVSYFRTPSELLTENDKPNQPIRLGGLVVENSVKRGEDTQTLFRVTDGEAEVTVVFSGILPDLFREGQGIIAEGVSLEDGRFEARTVLAKHDENYIPKELEHKLKTPEKSY